MFASVPNLRELGPVLGTLITGMRDAGVTYSEGLQQFRKRWLTQVLEICHGNQCHAAELLGIHRNTLARQLEELGVDVRTGRPQTWPHYGVARARVYRVNSVRKGGRGESPRAGGEGRTVSLSSIPVAVMPPASGSCDPDAGGPDCGRLTESAE